MLVNLITRSFDRSESGTETIPLSLTIRPACGLASDYDCQTDSKALLRLLRLKTDPPTYALERFGECLRRRLEARLMGMELSDSVLADMGYFIE